MGDQMLSKYLSVKRFTQSSTAARKGISNVIAPEHLDNARRFAAAYDYICDALGKHLGLEGPALLDGNSFYRSEALNIAVGGKVAPRSYHLDGLAGDLDDDLIDPKRTKRLDDFELATFIAGLEGLDYDKVILEYGWTHVQMARAGQKPRRLTWTIRFKGDPGIPGLHRT